MVVRTLPNTCLTLLLMVDKWVIAAIYNRMPDEIRWDRIDWSKPDRILAEHLGVSRQRVNRVRHEFNRRLANVKTKRLVNFKRMFSGRKNLSYQEALKRFPDLSRTAFWRYCRIMGIRTVSSRAPGDTSTAR